jgi:conjugal transfer pilus assembly protein TraW
MCLDLVTAKAIAVNGPIMKVMEDLDARLFFDQHGTLVKRFGIRALPSMVRQTGNVFVIEEFPL